MKLYRSTLSIQGAPLEGENPLPIFRSPERNRIVKENGSLTPAHKELLGYETGERFLPYRIQDRYTRKKREMTLQTIVIENEFLKAIVLPEYGGRLYSLLDKRTNREILYKNPVLQPANLAILNAWFSGGIEWNIGQLGHTFTTCSPVHAARLTDSKGNEFLRLYEYERCKNVFWHIDLHLPDGSEQLLVYVRIVNDNSQSVPMYWWTNIAVDETPKARVFSSTKEVIYIDPQAGGFGAGDLPILPTVSETDVSYPMNFPFSNEYFFQIAENDPSPWESIVYEDGRMFYERSTSLLRYRKMFCWGNHIGGRRWGEFLAEPGQGAYIELQGGFSPTQLHGIDQPAHTSWAFTQLFGVSQVEAEQANQSDWNESRAYVDEQVCRLLSAEQVNEVHRELQLYAEQEPLEILFTGSGWGALEQQRREKLEGRSVPKGFLFERASLDTPQQPWLALLETGCFPDIGVEAVPASWMIQQEWLDLLSESLTVKANESWIAYLHKGVMLYEQGLEDEAIQSWEYSLQLQPSAWAYRNLAVASERQMKMQQAEAYYEKALQLTGQFPDRAFAEEYLRILVSSKQYDKAWQVYQTLPASFASSERIQIIVGEAALMLNEHDFMKKLFASEFAIVREGELSVIDQWYKYHAKQLADAQHVELTEELIAAAVEQFPPPANLDFRMS
ncbi:DUF5107 domain-containing protein [Paenibacillus sp. IITD108]|uniref:DUF5107 domain-containing protein n=1 Tax=Paenibacillus sp. IITD108 TaxID=3116649 RepID=UPI002F414404